MKERRTISRILKPIGFVLVALGLLAIGFRAGVVLTQRNNLGMALMQFAYQVGYRDGLQKQLVMDNHDADRQLGVPE